jgi:hypothetical protein
MKKLRLEMCYCLLLLVLAGPGAATLQGQTPIFSEPLSPRIANYEIDVRLEPDTRMLFGGEVLRWRNASPDTLRELQFHLYLNAFRNSESTFMRESGGALRGISANELKDRWGWIEVDDMRLAGGESLAEGMEFISPDDGNPEDRTVLRVPLPQPLLPGDSLELEIDFTARLPRIFARTGFSDDNYFFVGQWFPKIGVYEAAGQRYAERGQWNCHQFHGNTEFYADFGNYDVNITLPEEFVVGATGLREDEQTEDGWKTLAYHAEDVTDFAWTAFPDYVVVEDTWLRPAGGEVAIRVLMAPEHAMNGPRYLQSAREALSYFEEQLGPYPYPNLTVVDPPLHASGAGGMEYPTLITGGSVYKLPEGLRVLEIVTVHEFGHQYFMHMLASNEFEEAWLDEGFNSYYEVRIMDHFYGPQSSTIDLLGFRMGDGESSRTGYTGMSNPAIAPIFRPAWQFTEGGYGSLTYAKTATVLRTLEGMVGRETMDEIMRTYFQRWRFRHPCARDFIAVVNEVVKARHGERFGPDLNWFFDQLLYGSGTLDYRISSLSNRKRQEDQGVFEVEAGEPVLAADSLPADSSWYVSEVVVHRRGEVVLPVELLVILENGDSLRQAWHPERTLWEAPATLLPGQEPNTETHRFRFEGPHKVVAAYLDPEHKLQVDLDFNNNSRQFDPPASPFWKYTLKFLFWFQNLMQLVSVFA